MFLSLWVLRELCSPLSSILTTLGSGAHLMAWKNDEGGTYDFDCNFISMFLQVIAIGYYH